MSDFLLSLKDVSLAFGGPQILDKVSLSIHKGLRAALTGRNGEGKSTLMKVIAGTLEPDTGEIVRAPGLKVVYVGQGVEESEVGSRSRTKEDLNSTVRLPTTTTASSQRKLSYNEQRELAALPDRIDALEKEIAAIEAFLSDGSNYARDPAKCKSDSERLPLAKSELDAAESRWLELEERKM